MKHFTAIYRDLKTGQCRRECITTQTMNDANYLALRKLGKGESLFNLLNGWRPT